MSGDHFRGYVDGKLMVHDHGPARDPGRMGLLVAYAAALLLIGGLIAFALTAGS